MTDEPESEIVERTVETDNRDANYLILEAIADVENVDVTELPPMYNRIDHMLDELFSEPPVDKAQVQVTFSYYGYRATVNQSGTVTLRKLDPKPNEAP